MTKEKCPAATGIAVRGGKLSQVKAYQQVDENQAPALSVLDVVHDLEVKTLSALWWGLPSAFDVCLAASLDDAACFAFAWHSELFRVLASCALQGFVPTITDALTVMRVAFPDSLLRCADQMLAIRIATSSAACLQTWAALVVRAARRRRQVVRLHKCLKDRIADPIGYAPRGAASTSIIGPTMTHRPRFSPRAVAAVFGGIGHE